METLLVHSIYIYTYIYMRNEIASRLFFALFRFVQHFVIRFRFNSFSQSFRKNIAIPASSVLTKSSVALLFELNQFILLALF